LVDPRVHPGGYLVAEQGSRLGRLPTYVAGVNDRSTLLGVLLVDEHVAHTEEVDREVNLCERLVVPAQPPQGSGAPVMDILIVLAAGHHLVREAQQRVRLLFEVIGEPDRGQCDLSALAVGIRRLDRPGVEVKSVQRPRAEPAECGEAQDQSIVVELRQPREPSTRDRSRPAGSPGRSGRSDPRHERGRRSSRARQMMREARDGRPVRLTAPQRARAACAR
jgi:hypothetical protein